MNNNNWEHTGKLVMAELQRLSQGQDTIREDIRQLCVDVATLKTKAGIVGGSAGAVVGVITSAIATVLSKLIGN